MSRVVIYNKDVMELLGKGKSTAHNLLSRLRDELQRPKSKPITIEEFCDFMGLDYETAKFSLLKRG